MVWGPMSRSYDGVQLGCAKCPGVQGVLYTKADGLQ